VERQVLFKEVWGDTAPSDDTLTHHISEIRHAFGDNAAQPRFLQTIPRHGYRLIAPVTPLPEQQRRDPDRGERGFVARQYEDLRNRKVFQIVAGYPVLAWLVVQVLDVIWEYMLQPLGAPDWLVPSFVVLIALGYPFSIFVAWAVDLTPEGLRLGKVTADASRLASLTVLGVIALLVTSVGLYLYFNAYEPADVRAPERTERAASAAPPEGSIAVLRFLSIGANPTLGYLGDGLTEELIHKLANLGTIKVASRTSVWPLSDTELTTTEIARRLNVERVLEGTVRSDGDTVRVTAQLTDDDGFHIWSKTFDRPLQDLLSIEKNIAALVAEEMDMPQTAAASQRLAQTATLDPRAFDQYLQGRHFLRQTATPENLDAAQTHFDAAIDIDNRFSLAYAGRCETELARYRLTQDTGHFSAAEVACHRALTLDGGLAEVYTALGNLYRESGQNEKAYQEFTTALSINPSLEASHYGLARVHEAQGRLEEAEGELRFTVKLEPGYYGTHLGLGNFLWRAGRYQEALPYYQTVTALEPNYAGGFINLGSALYWLGELDAAEVAWQRSLELAPMAMGYQNMGTLYYYQHRFADAADMHQRAIEMAPADHRAWGKLAAAQRYIEGQEEASEASYLRAIELVNERLAVNPDDAEDMAHLAAYLVNTGRGEEARTVAYRAIELAPDNPSTHYFAAIVEIRSGAPEVALKLLKAAVSNGYSARLIAVDPQFESVKEESIFKTLIARNEATPGLRGD
jgi:TolB-like protein/Tfp pilus assembly protein PilF